MKAISWTLLILLLASCGPNVEIENVPGRYVFTHGNRDTIDIDPDGTFIHHKVSDGQATDKNGTWNLNPAGNEICFKYSYGNWYSRLRTKGNEIHLMYESDLNAYYKKLTVDNEE